MSMVECALLDAGTTVVLYFFFLNDTATTDIYTYGHTLSLHDALPIFAASWQRLGYPFERLVPSYATSIGSSGDRPAALAELMGIIANDGMRLPTSRFERLRFAEGTPYETVMTRDVEEIGRAHV